MGKSHWFLHAAAAGPSPFMMAVGATNPRRKAGRQAGLSQGTSRTQPSPLFPPHQLRVTKPGDALQAEADEGCHTDSPPWLHWAHGFGVNRPTGGFGGSQRPHSGTQPWVPSASAGVSLLQAHSGDLCSGLLGTGPVPTPAPPNSRSQTRYPKPVSPPPPLAPGYRVSRGPWAPLPRRRYPRRRETLPV